MYNMIGVIFVLAYAFVNLQKEKFPADVLEPLIVYIICTLLELTELVLGHDAASR